MVLKLNVSKSTIILKIALSKLIDGYPKIKESKMIREVCKENAGEFR